MSRGFRLVRLAGLLLALTAWQVSSAEAQQQVRVVTDQTTVWSPAFGTIATVVRVGTVLEVVRRQGDWFEIVLPDANGPTTGMIAATRVEMVGAGSARGTPAGEPRPGLQRRGVTRRPSMTPHVQVFGSAGYGWFAARQSFEAVTGNAAAPWFGGGVRFQSSRGYYLEGVVERFQAAGERVFVFEDIVYPLGIDNRTSVTPLMGMVGYTVPGRRYSTYLGAGAGAYLLRETSDFADDGDSVKETHAAYRGVLGVQWPLAKGLAAGVEVQYTTVPRAFTSGAAAAFDESDLGGIQIRGKLLFGR